MKFELKGFCQTNIPKFNIETQMCKIVVRRMYLINIHVVTLCSLTFAINFYFYLFFLVSADKSLIHLHV